MNTLIAGSIQWLEKIPHSLIAFIARFSIAAVFWKSGQTKIEGLAIDLFDGTFQIGLPRLADSTVPLFKSEYALPLLSPELAAHLAASAEHVFPVLILFGLATRFFSAGLAGDDLDHPAVRLPGRLPDPWHLGSGLALLDGARAGGTVHRPPDCQALRPRLNTDPLWERACSR
nr:hypothetical protein GCM10020185_15050 [Pseudomonas brassicacearum subsp. brassicacearum]